MGRVERRRKWSEAEKAALLAKVSAPGGKVALVARRRHGILESLLYNWRAAARAAASTQPTTEPVEFVPIGVFGRAEDEGPAMIAVPSERRSPRYNASTSRLDGRAARPDRDRFPERRPDPRRCVRQ
jgi:transposase